MGGTAAMAKWANANKSDFYTKLYAKLVPMNIEGEFGGLNGEPIQVHVGITFSNGGPGTPAA